jgi:hypothetical protein
MPIEGQYQQPAGVDKHCGCPSSCDCESVDPVTMRRKTPGFILKAPEYKGNPVLNAQK